MSGMVFPAVVVLIVTLIFIICVSGVSFLDVGDIPSNSFIGINSDIVYGSPLTKFKKLSAPYAILNLMMLAKQVAIILIFA